MSGLPREVLKWVQSLDLSYSVKNTRRDFSNGFLLAEILSRYYRQDIQMHSFVCGESRASKASNWGQLRKFLSRANISLKPSLVDDVMFGRPNAAVALLKEIYTFLTQKPVQELEGDGELNLTPPYARPTASKLVKDAMKGTDALPKGSSMDFVHNTASNVISEHEASLRAERLSKPGRFGKLGGASPSRSSSSKVQRVPQRVLGRDSQKNVVDQLQFIKEVNVKHIETNVAALRASKSSMRNQRSGSATFGPDASEGNKALHLPRSKSVNEILGDVVETTLGDNELIGTGEDAMVSFVNAVTDLDDSTVSDVIRAWNSECCKALSESCLASPKEFWRLMSYMEALLSSSGVKSTTFTSTIEFVNNIGRQMVTRNTSLPFALFQDFALPQLVNLILWNPRKRPQLVQLLFSFATESSDERMKVKRRLQEALKDIDVFISCLASLVPLEAELSDKALDLYLYYSVIGLRRSCPRLRSAALAILTSLARHENAHDSVQQLLLERLSTLVEDVWWQVQLGIVEVCCALLSRLNEHDQDVEEIYVIVQSLLTSTSNVSVLKVGLARVAEIMHMHAPLQHVFFDIALHDASVRTFLLSPGEQHHDIPDGVLGAIEVRPLAEVWHRASALNSLARYLNGGRLSHGHRQLLLQCCRPAQEAQATLADDDWNSAPQQLLQAILTDAVQTETAPDAFVLLNNVLDYDCFLPTAIKMFTGDEDAPLLEPLRVILSNHDEVCSQEVFRFMEKAVTSPREFRTSAVAFLRILLSEVPDTETTQALAKLVLE